MKFINLLYHCYKIKRFKMLCLNPVYFAGCEMYRLLNYDILQELVKKVPSGNVTLSSNLLFDRKIITKEEQFLYILNKYIVFVRNNFFINANELTIIIEETLKSKYSKILYNDLEFNKNDNYQIYYKEFKRMFLDSLFNNFKKYYKDRSTDDLIIKLKNYSLDNDNDIEELFIVFKEIINNRKDDLFNFFINNNELNDFHRVKWNNLINEYMLTKKKG